MFYINEVLNITGGRLLGRGTTDPIRSFTIDSRTCQPGTCFAALAGEHTHGGEFIAQAFVKGATAALIDEAWVRKNQAQHVSGSGSMFELLNVAVVQDVKKALSCLAKHHRKRLSLRAVAITGSSGKTSTKELVRQMLSGVFRVHASPESFNNDLGVPLTLLSLREEHQVLVQELGASEAGSIRTLTEWVRPDIGVLTNVGPAHLKGFKSLDGVYEAKLELARAVSERRGVFIYGSGDAILEKKLSRYAVRKIPFGDNVNSPLKVTETRRTNEGFFLTINEKETFFLPTPAAFQIRNVLAALTVTYVLNVDLDICREALSRMVWPRSRFAVVPLGAEIMLVDDTYNANPMAFAASLDAFSKIPARRHIVVCGDMLELGEESAHYHEELGRDLRERRRIDAVLCVGQEMRYAREVLKDGTQDAAHTCFPSTGEASQFLKEFIRSGDAVLLKASRGMHFEEIVESLKSCFISSPKL